MNKLFEFHSKSSTLEKLKPLLNISKILPIYSFNVGNWKKNKKLIIKQIRKKFKKKVIIRSSAIGEDSIIESQAGKYLSINKINPSNLFELNQSIEKVIKSYKSDNLKNQILVQPMLQNVSMSGVLFTHDNENGSPYYCIEYDDLTGSTDTVTSGLNDKSRTLYVLRNSFKQLKSKRFLKLINASREIEKLTSSSKLDIEFGVNKNNEVFIFQVRPIITKKNIKKKEIIKIDKQIKKFANNFGKKLKKNKKNIGKENLFGVMPDWNPAEIIGITPQPLSSSLYSKIITDDIWSKSRKSLGYRNLTGKKLIKDFASHPYININYSFNSFLPKKLNNNISKKLINFWTKDLIDNGYKHDKIEFEVCNTCFDFDINNQLKKYKSTLSRKEIIEFKYSLFELTKKIILKNETEIKLYNQNLHNLEIFRKNFNKNKKINFKDINNFIFKIKKYGTYTFANAARIAFISENILRSLSKLNLLKFKRIEKFKNTINTVLSEFVDDTSYLVRNKITWNLFKKKYGHLRSGTYDIISDRYDKSNYFKSLKLDPNIKKLHKKNFKLTKKEELKIDRVIKKNKLDLSVAKLFKFIKSNISFREYSKFIFTKSLSDLLERIATEGKKRKLSRQDLSYLKFKDLKLLFNQNKIYELNNVINRNKNVFKFNKLIKLPYLITKKSDFSIIPLLKGLPNFITSKKIVSKIVHLKYKEENKSKILNNKIIVIEKADPGYDWIFLHGISGLITKYGGSNSHMAIRCAELNVPAAIGCGDQLYRRLEKSNFIELDCFSKKIKLIN